MKRINSKIYASAKERVFNTKENWFLPLKEDLLLVMLAINSISNGFFIFSNEGQAKSSTDSYEALIKIMPMDVWGTLFLITGIMVLIGAIFVKDFKTKAYLLLISGFMGFCLWTIYSLIGVEFGSSGIAPIRNMAFSIIHLVLGFIQIIEIWRIRLQLKRRTII